MHEPVKSRLEDYLSGGGPFSDVEAHLRSCDSCRRELDAMLEQSQLFGVLRSPIREPEIRPDFYARVMGTIEVQTRPSMWVLFGESLFARRLAYASAAFLMLLGTFLISSTTDPQQAVVASSPEVILAGHSSEELPTPIDVQPSQRGVVLVNLASYNQDFQ